MMMTTESTFLSQLTENLLKLSKSGKNGVLICKNTHPVAEIYLISGKLLFVLGYKHRVRRWQRAITQNALQSKIEPIELLNSQPWEYEFLHHALTHKKITLNEFKEVVRAISQEFLFELTGYTDLKMEWEEHEKKESGLAIVLALSSDEIEKMVVKAIQQREEWDKAGLRVLSPCLAPLRKADTPDKNINLIEGLDGKLTLWDLALKRKTPIIEFTNLLIPFIRRGLLKFKDVPDLPPPVLPKPVSKSEETIPKSVSKSPIQSTSKDKTSTVIKSGRKKGLIACIDDSPVVAHGIKSILIPSGYEILEIPEPMHGFSTLIEHQPDLILLDINMPNANGYSVCQFLRNSPIFEKTPIIILTGQDTNIDRARAKLVGATDFIGKPAKKELLLPMLEKYIK